MIRISNKTKKKYNLKIHPEVLTSPLERQISKKCWRGLWVEKIAPESVAVVASGSVFLHDKII